MLSGQGGFPHGTRGHGLSRGWDVRWGSRLCCEVVSCHRFGAGSLAGLGGKNLRLALPQQPGIAPTLRPEAAQIGPWPVSCPLYPVLTGNLAFGLSRPLSTPFCATLG